MTRIFGLGKTSAAALAIACFCACARQGAADGDLFRVAAVNCGAFLYGADRATPEEFASEWKRFAHEGKYDIIFYSDVGKGSPGNFSVEGFDIRAASARRPVSVSQVHLPQSIETPDGCGKTGRFRALRMVYDIGGRKLAAYGVHLVAEGHIKVPRVPGRPSLSQQLRRRQFEALLADARRFDLAVLAGDFNAQKPWEYDVFSKAGYSVGNCSAEFGTTATLRNIPADNVVVSPGLALAGFDVLKNYTLDTDHFPVAATVRLPPK